METKSAVPALAALAQESRLAAYRLLVEHAPDGLPAGAIAVRLGIPPATLSFHLKELSHAGLVVSRAQGRFVWYCADLATMNELVAYLTENCCSSSAVCDAACVPAPVTSTPAVAARPPERRSRP